MIRQDTRTGGTEEGFDRRPCKIAFIGAGYMAREHIRAFRDIPGVEIAGICSRTVARAEALVAEYAIPCVCGSVSELYERTAADLVVVAVPPLVANDVCKSCFEYPWVSLIEKPAGYNVADAEDIEAAARRKGRRAYVALNRRHYASTRRVLADLANQDGPRLIKVQDQQDQAVALRIGHPQLVVDNWMYACSIHLIDYFFLLGRGKITDVSPIIRWNPAEPLYVASRITFESGDVGLYEAIWQGPGPWAISANVPGKRWEMRPLESAAFQLPGSRVLERVEDDAWDIQFKAGLRKQAELAVLACTEAQTELPTLGMALDTMRLVQRIYA
jgi:predicted dehydrogenase